MANDEIICTFATVPSQIQSRLYFELNFQNQLDDFYLSTASPVSIPIGECGIETVGGDVPDECIDALTGLEMNCRDLKDNHDHIFGLYGTVVRRVAKQERFPLGYKLPPMSRE